MSTKNTSVAKDPEVRYYQNALAIAAALLAGRLDLAMLATHGQYTQFVHVAIDEIVAAARNGWSVVVYAVPPDLRAKDQLASAIQSGTAQWLGDYYQGWPVCGELLWLLHAEFTGEQPPA